MSQRSDPMQASPTCCLPSSQGELTAFSTFGGRLGTAQGWILQLLAGCRVVNTQTYTAGWNLFWNDSHVCQTLNIQQSIPALRSWCTDKGLLIQHASRGNTMVSIYQASSELLPYSWKGLCKEATTKVSQWRWCKKEHNQKAKLKEHTETNREPRK